MDRDIIYIYDILQNSQNRLTTSDISREILSKYNVKISKKIIQNYLWSFFRHDIDYMPEEYTYLLKDKFSNFKIDDQLVVVHMKAAPRALNVYVKGAQVVIEYNDSVLIDDLLKALGYLYLNGLNNKYDLVKNINKAIDNL